MDESHMRIEISDFVMRTFVLTLMKDSLLTVFFFFVEIRQRLYFPKVWFPAIIYAASPPWPADYRAARREQRRDSFLYTF